MALLEEKKASLWKFVRKKERGNSETAFLFKDFVSLSDNFEIPINQISDNDLK